MTTSGLHDPYEDQLASARYRAERDQARQDAARLRSELERAWRELEDISGRESDALEWVEEQGGLGEVRATWDEALNLCATIGCEPSSAETLVWALGECTDIVAARLMPEGMEWPRYKDGELIRFGDEFENAKGNASTLRTVVIKDCRGALGSAVFWKLGKGECAVTLKNGERVKRPAPAVLAADGEPLEVGQTVYLPGGTSVHVTAIGDMTEGHQTVFGKAGNDSTDDEWYAAHLTHQRPVLDADGVPIKKGDTVYGTVKGGPFIVTEVSDKGSVFVDAFPDTGMHGSMFTHAEPELQDSASAISGDLAKMAASWKSWPLLKDAQREAARQVGEDSMGKALDSLARRCKALSERSE